MMRHSQHPTARRAARQRASSDRSRRYRQRLTDAGIPNARDIDAAVSEAMSFHVARDGIGVNIEVRSMLKTARIILERRGFDPAASAQALANRIGHRDEHTWPDFVPSLRPGPIDRMRPPVGRDTWFTPLPDIMRHLAGSDRP